MRGGEVWCAQNAADENSSSLARGRSRFCFASCRCEPCSLDMPFRLVGSVVDRPLHTALGLADIATGTAAVFHAWISLRFVMQPPAAAAAAAAAAAVARDERQGSSREGAVVHARHSRVPRGSPGQKHRGWGWAAEGPAARGRPPALEGRAVAVRPPSGGGGDADGNDVRPRVEGAAADAFV